MRPSRKNSRRALVLCVITGTLLTALVLALNTPVLMEQWLTVEKDVWLVSILDERLRQARAAERQ